jgi:hypothetical protein
MACKVKYCRFSISHVTKSHVCGKCKKLGHGEIECGDQYKINRLNMFLNDEILIDMQCSFGGCSSKKYHTIDAHHCEHCNERLHSKETCPKIIKNYNINCPICKQNNIFSINQQKVFNVSELCCICMTDPVEIYLPNCGHICICNLCCIELDKKNKDLVSINLLNNIRSEEFLISQSLDLDLIKSKLKPYPSYLKILYDMNNICIIRRLNINSKLEAIYETSEDHLIDTKIDQINKFLEGYAYINILHLFH